MQRLTVEKLNDGHQFRLFDAQNREVKLRDALYKLAQDNHGYLVRDMRSVPVHLRPKHAEGAVLAKEDLRTAKEKSDFIAANSLAVFEALPMKRPVKIDGRDIDSLDRETYLALPPAERAKIADKVGEYGISRILLRRKK